MLRADFCQGWIVNATPIRRVSAAGNERATRRGSGKVGRKAFDRLKLRFNLGVQSRQGIEKSARIWMSGAGIELVHGCLLDDIARVHDGDAIGQARHHAGLGIPTKLKSSTVRVRACRRVMPP